MMGHSWRLRAVIASSCSLGLLTVSGCKPSANLESTSASPSVVESGDSFIQRVNGEMLELSREQSAAGFAYATYINQDTELLNAKANERYLSYFSKTVEQA